MLDVNKDEIGLKLFTFYRHFTYVNQTLLETV